MAKVIPPVCQIDFQMDYKRTDRTELGLLRGCRKTFAQHTWLSVEHANIRLLASFSVESTSEPIRLILSRLIRFRLVYMFT